MPPKTYRKYAKKSSTNTVESSNLTSAKYLIIVESPSKCAKIESYLGINYCCIASRGHIRTVNGLKSIDTKGDFSPTFSVIPEKKDHIESMREIIKMFSNNNILLATDDDREGGAIAWHICEMFGLSIEETPRIIFHEVTKPALIEAVKNPVKINMPLVKAQHARQVLDVIVGYKISPFLWKYLYHNKSNSLSAGRCQTPALRLVYDNDLQTRTNSELEYKYKISGKFTSRNIKFDLNDEFTSEKEVLDFLSKTTDYSHNMNIGSPNDVIRSPPKPFSTSRLLQTSSNILNISPKDTMSICQQLYQTGYITYMRTESSQYSKTFLEHATKYITDQYKSESYIGELSKIENKDVTNPHEAIRVTQLANRSIPSEDKRLVALYKLIWRNTIESCMADAKMQTTKIEISTPLDYKYVNTIETPIFLGWKIVNEKPLDVNDQNTPVGTIFFLKMMSPNNVPHTQIESSVVVRNKHHHYTEASLIQKLEEIGIGRPSTFATIVDTIQERGYVKRGDIEGIKMECREHTLSNKTIKTLTTERTFGNEKNKLTIEPVGIVTIDFLLKHYEEMFSYEYTKIMESKLDLISSGELTDWSNVCKECYDEIVKLSKPVEKISKQTYTIDDEHIFTFDKYGPVIRCITDPDNLSFLSVRKDINIDLAKLEKGEYNLEDLLEKKEKILGSFENLDVVLKNGRYGLYIECGERHETLKDINKTFDEIKYEDVISRLDKSKQATTEPEKGVLRKLNDDMSIRKGKFGAYVYYKRPDMGSPRFLNIKKFSEGYLGCEPTILINWLCKTYNLPNP